MHLLQLYETEADYFLFEQEMKYIKQGHLENQFYLIKDLGNNMLVQNGSTGEAVRD